MDSPESSWDWAISPEFLQVRGARLPTPMRRLPLPRITVCDATPCAFTRHERSLALELRQNRPDFHLDLSPIHLTFHFGELRTGQTGCQTFEVGEDSPSVGGRHGNREFVVEIH